MLRGKTAPANLAALDSAALGHTPEQILNIVFVIVGVLPSVRGICVGEIFDSGGAADLGLQFSTCLVGKLMNDGASLRVSAGCWLGEKSRGEEHGARRVR